MEDSNEESVIVNGSNTEDGYEEESLPTGILINSFDFPQEGSNSLPPYRQPKKKHVSFWKRPATKVYRDNFGFGVNGYQPMIDYLDSKDTGGSANKNDVHLPSLEERCMTKYSSDRPIKLYTNREIDSYIDKGEKIRTQIRQNDAAGASNVLRRTHTNWSMTSKYVQLVKNSYVSDYREGHKNKKVEVIKPNYNLEPKTIVYNQQIQPNCIDMDSLIGSYHVNRMDHGRDMAERREKLRYLDDQYEESIARLSATVDKMNRSANTVSRVITPQGNIYSVNEVQSATNEAIQRNRYKREQDLDRLCSEVDSITSCRYRPRNEVQYLGDQITGVNAMSLALARKNAIDASVAMEQAENFKASLNFYGSSEAAVTDKINDLRYRSRNLAILDYKDLSSASEPRRRRVVVHDDVVSDVQERIMNRAREMSGSTSEIRRINNRAKYVNTVRPRPNTGDTELLIAPTKTERNIDYMAKSLAYNGKAVRKFDIDEEVDQPLNPLNTNLLETYCSRKNDKVIPQILSDSHAVRNAVVRARERNCLLGHQ